MTKPVADGTALPPVQHRGGKTKTVLSCIAGIGVLLMLSSCGEISMYAALDSQEPGPFRMAQAEVLLPLGGEFQLAATGGFRPYTFELVTALDTEAVHASSGLFQAPGSSTVARVVGTDRFGARSSVFIRIFPPLRATPSTIAVETSDNRTVPIIGGYGSLSLGDEQPRGLVSLVGNNVEYTAPAEVGDGTDRCEVTDELGNVAVVRVTVFAPDALRLEANPANRVIQPDGQVVFDAFGGSGFYSFSVELPYDNTHLTTSGSSTTFAPAGGTQDAFVTVTDTVDPQQSVTVMVIVVSDPAPQPLSISPSGGNFLSGTTVEFTASGGVPPYTLERYGPGSGQPVAVTGTTNKWRYTLIKPPPPRKFLLTDHAGDSIDITIRID